MHKQFKILRFPFFHMITVFQQFSETLVFLIYIERLIHFQLRKVFYLQIQLFDFSFRNFGLLFYIDNIYPFFSEFVSYFFEVKLGKFNLILIVRKLVFPIVGFRHFHWRILRFSCKEFSLGYFFLFFGVLFIFS